MFIRLLKYSIKNILRNKFLSISSILVLTLLMFFINLLLIVHHTSFKLIWYVNDKMSISLYLNEQYDKNSNDVIDFIENIKKQISDIDIKYKSKDEVLEQIKSQDPEFVQILEKDNPLPNTIIIKNIPLDSYNKLNYIIEWKLYLFSNSKKQDIKESKNEVFADYKAQYNRIQKVITILKYLWVWVYIIIWVFVFAIAIITYSIIWNFIYYYRDEIYITKLVGWSRIFIYWPFSLQWMIYSAIAFFISLALFFGFLNILKTIFINNFSLDFILNNSFLVFLLELLLFILLGWISWYFSSKKYLK